MENESRIWDWTLVALFIAIPLAALGTIWACRMLLKGRIPWLATDQGGAVLALAMALAEAALALAAVPGKHGVAAGVLWVLITLIRNKAIFGILQKLGVDLSVDPTPVENTLMAP